MKTIVVHLWLLLLRLRVIMTVLGAIIPPMYVDIASRHSSSEEHIEELFGGNVSFKAARVIVVRSTTRSATLCLRLVGAV